MAGTLADDVAGDLKNDIKRLTDIGSTVLDALTGNAESVAEIENATAKGRSAPTVEAPVR